MARLLAQSLARPSPATAASLLPLRGLSTKVELIEIDLAEEDPSSVEVVGIRRMEGGHPRRDGAAGHARVAPFRAGRVLLGAPRAAPPRGSPSSSAGSRRPGSASVAYEAEPYVPMTEGRCSPSPRPRVAVGGLLRRRLTASVKLTGKAVEPLRISRGVVVVDCV
ncbi:hypothetical protein D1007_12779 [Hordeum vulgare]|nr:hypothetical protein D1007_12779 [Hordeum vulgare]